MVNELVAVEFVDVMIEFVEDKVNSVGVGTGSGCD